MTLNYRDNEHASDFQWSGGLERAGSSRCFMGMKLLCDIAMANPEKRRWTYP